MNQPLRIEQLAKHPSAPSVKAIENLIKQSSFGIPAVQDLREQVPEDQVEDVLGRITQQLAEEHVEGEPSEPTRDHPPKKGMDWRHRARCRDADPELFFPVGTTGPAEAQVQAAKAICALCPVRDECLQWALDTAQDAGVWGGLSEEERRALRRIQRQSTTQKGLLA
jgi:WhiB family redox-sensing transcriptional regulator